MKKLSDPVQLGSVTTRNRICVPPMVLYGYAGPEGLVTSAHIAHYRRLAQGGAGLIIQEATCISPQGRLREDQLGIWSDRHIPGLRSIVEAVHQEGCPIFLQLHHAGIVGIGEDCLCPDAYMLRHGGQEKRGHKMTQADICRIRDAFIAGAVRAEQAGYDGVELHGCHSYLLCQFLNPRVNRREDRYGDPTALILEILWGIRERTSLVVGIRLGALEPDLQEGLRHAVALAKADFLDLSFGFSWEMDEPATPEVLHRATKAIKAQVDVPVFAVNGIRTPAQAEAVLQETGADMVDIGRSCLVDPSWPRKALSGEAPGFCLGCKVCQWRIDSEKCPGRKRNSL
jgi:2,4-dienoyl-CoA reductase-like NADH-dependent reductase (Old Yellow Enzyme family)